MGEEVSLDANSVLVRKNNIAWYEKHGKQPPVRDVIRASMCRMEDYKSKAL